MTTTEAADYLGFSVEWVRALARTGVLKAHTTSGETGPGQRMYFDRGEVEAMRKGGGKAAKAFQNRKRVKS